VRDVAAQQFCKSKVSDKKLSLQLFFANSNTGLYVHIVVELCGVTQVASGRWNCVAQYQRNLSVKMPVRLSVLGTL